MNRPLPRTSDPVHDASRYMDHCDALDAAIKAEQDNTDPSPEDYVRALEPEYFDASDLITACHNSPFDRYSPEWIAHVIRQCRIDEKQIDSWAEDIKNDRVARDFRGVGS